MFVENIFKTKIQYRNTDHTIRPPSQHHISTAFGELSSLFELFSLSLSFLPSPPFPFPFSLSLYSFRSKIPLFLVPLCVHVNRLEVIPQLIAFTFVFYKC